MEQNRVAGRLLPGGLAEVDNEDGSKTLLRFVGVDGQSMKFEPVENDGHEMTLRGSSVAERHVVYTCNAQVRSLPPELEMIQC